MCRIVGFGTKGLGFKTIRVKFGILNVSFPTQVNALQLRQITRAT